MLNGGDTLQGFKAQSMGGPKAGASGFGFALGQTVFSLTPVTAFGFKRADLVTDAEIAAMRAAGSLPSSLTMCASKGYGGPVSALSWDGTSAMDATPSTASGMMAQGDGWVLQASNVLNVFTAAHIGFGSGVRGFPTLTGPVPTGVPISVSYTNGEFHYLTTNGVYSFTLGTKNPLSNAAIPCTKFGVGIAGAGVGGLRRIIFYRGLYIAHATEPNLAAPGNVPRFSADRVTWTLCTVPALNQDGAGPAGGVIVAMAVNPFTGLLVAITGYGETLTSSDGMTFTKTAVRAPGGAAVFAYNLSITASGKLFAGVVINSFAAAMQVLSAPNAATLLAPVTVAGGGVVAGAGAVRAAAYHMSALWVVFPTTVAGQTYVAVSFDEGATWAQALATTTGDGTLVNAQLGALAALFGGGGFVWAVAPGGPPYFVRIDTDFGRMTAPIPDMLSGATLRAYVKVA